MRFCTLASGSSGNCTYIGTGKTHILVDAGPSRKRIEEGLNSLALSLKDINAIFLTHEHSDHIGGLGMIMKQYDIPVYATAGTLKGLTGAASRNKADAMLRTGERTACTLRADERIQFRDLTVTPFRISHDAAEPVGFRIGAQGRCAVIATDMGCYNDDTIAHLQGADILLLEANHDVRMLQTGPYPYPLKQRILGTKGHLSNDAAGTLLSGVLHDRLHTVMLGHLSEKNNLPELAYETVRLEIDMNDTPYRSSDFHLTVADRMKPSALIELA